MKRAWTNGLAAMLVLAAGSVAVFIFTTVASDEMPDALTAGAAPVIALLLTVVFGGLPRADRVRTAGHRAGLNAVAGGVAALWAAPYIVLVQRLSDSPPGSEIVFLTLSVWGAAVVLGAYGVRVERPPITSAAGAVAAVAGAAALLASWERPSSFSLFIRYAEREVWMLVAGVVFAVGMLAICAAVRSMGVRDAAPLALAGASAAGLLGVIPVVGALGTVTPTQWMMLLYLGLATAVAFGAWLRAFSRAGASRAAVGLLVAPFGLTLVTFIERLTGVYGPDPFEWVGILVGSSVVVAGCAVVWLAVPATRLHSSHQEGPPSRLAVALAALALVLATASLFTPGISASSEGHAAAPFSATWSMLGAETAAGWLTLAAALLLAVAVFERASAARASRIAALCTSVACGAGAVLVAATPLHTWTTWIPADVQQTYGTEYARFTTEALIDPVRVAALSITGIAVLVTAVSLARSTRNSSEEVT